MTNNRQYIGKGKQGKFGTIRVSINVNDAEQFIREHKDAKYLNFFVSKLQSPDQFGNTHTAYGLQSSENLPTE